MDKKTENWRGRIVWYTINDPRLGTNAGDREALAGSWWENEILSM